MEHVRSGLRLVSHAAVGVGAGSLAAVSTVLPSTGGAIDLIAVKQRDGSLKCSPFYVRFGKYQGLIRGREKVVTVTVNGVLMDFTMRLGRSGEAFFVVSYARDGKPSGSDADQDVSSAALAFEDSLNEAADAWRSYDGQVETGTKEADELTKRFGPWYYVIDKELFDKLKPGRADLVQAKAQDADAPAQDGGK